MADDSHFAIDEALERVAEAVRDRPPAGLFALAEEGFDAPFEILLACVISIRTKDETMLPIARRLFEAARTPAEVAELGADALAERIRGCAFAERKARQLHDTARFLVERYRGRLPCSRDILLSFDGVGPKCAGLVMGIACEDPVGVPVDVHVHRIANRWGYVATTSPDQTRRALEATLPKRHWLAINRWLVPFGKHVCTAQRPWCSRCPLREMCPQNGVEASR